MNWKDFINFQRMITPLIIKVLFWIGVGLSVISGIWTFFGGIISGINNDSFLLVIGGLIGGPISILFGVMTTRIFSELLILFFQISETLTDIKSLLEQN